MTTPSTPTLTTPSLAKMGDPHCYVIFIHPLQSGLFRIHLQHKNAQTDRCELVLRSHWSTTSRDEMLEFYFSEFEWRFLWWTGWLSVDALSALLCDKLLSTSANVDRSQATSSNSAPIPVFSSCLLFLRISVVFSSFQPPHVRRKLKIKEIVDTYRHKTVDSEFYTSLFHDLHTN